MMMFAILFGLSMDYEVFLLSRIREEYAPHGDNALAVADGLAATARVITAAAAIMVCGLRRLRRSATSACSSCSGSDSPPRCFIDATLVRMVLVPADHGAARRRQLVAPAAGSTASSPTIDVEGNEPLPSIDRPETDAAGNTSDSEEPVKTLV